MARVVECRTRIRYADTDQMGVVHHAKYLEYFEIGRTEYMRRRGLSYAEVERRGIFLALVEGHIRWRRAGRYDGEISIRTWMEELSGAKVKFRYEVLDERGDTLADGWTVLGSVNGDGRAVRIPAWLRESLEEDA